MKNYFNPNPVHWYGGVPFIGKFEFCQYGTTEAQSVYDVDGNDLGNVIYTASDGRMEHEVYLDGDYSVRWWLFVGNNTSMADDDDEDNFRLVYTQSILSGTSSSASSSVTPVTSIGDLAALEDMDDGACVLVTGYYDDGDSPARFYMWDANCTTTADSGYIVASGSSSTGRWILLWDSDVIPCECYGVIPDSDKFGNLQYLLAYPESVGTFGLKTAPVIRFSAGTYTASNFSTDKDISLAEGFSYDGVITCRSVSVDAGASDVCQGFVVTDNSCVIDAEWVTDASTLNFGTNNIMGVSRAYSFTFLKELIANAFTVAGRAVFNGAITATSTTTLSTLNAGTTTLDKLNVNGDATFGDGTQQGTFTIDALISTIVNGDTAFAGDVTITGDVKATGMTRVRDLQLPHYTGGSWYPLNSYLNRNWKLYLERSTLQVIPALSVLDEITIEIIVIPNASWSVSLYTSASTASVTWSGSDPTTAEEDYPGVASFDSTTNILSLSFRGDAYSSARFVKYESATAGGGLMTCKFKPYYT